MAMPLQQYAFSLEEKGRCKHCGELFAPGELSLVLC